MAKSIPHGELHPYPNQGDPVPCRPSSGRLRQGNAFNYSAPDLDNIGDCLNGERGGGGRCTLKRDDLRRYLSESLDPRLCLRRHIANVANSVRERTAILQKLTGTKWGAKSSLRERFMLASYNQCSNTQPGAELTQPNVSRKAR
ncbi:hypothetical protein PoB_000497800 [Plakobranchus ocellatus]|uniref:SERTA domain-containing protein n=1 Tax=Plakobranchus ocellatus TaxID=259542 RepID=A0AAV3Y8H7_9GAST|nr:hypothetical protein PoB_000497800 [Plakobranchus ocellatus]